MPGDDRPQHQRVLHAERLAGMLILEPALILIGIHAEACPQGVGQRGVQRARDVDVGRFATAFHRSTQRGFVAVSRRSGVKQDRAADDITAEQHALRATQDLDRLQVEGVVQHRRIRAHIHAVYEDADRRVDTRNRAVDTQTTNGEVRDAACRASIVQGYVWHAYRQRGQVAHLESVELFGVEGGDRHRHVLEQLFPLLSGHNNIFQHRGAFESHFFRLGLLGCGREREDGDAQHHNDAQYKGDEQSG